jgi:hypothetical protein
MILDVHTNANAPRQAHFQGSPVVNSLRKVTVRHF